jgi:hypothetical protein
MCDLQTPSSSKTEESHRKSRKLSMSYITSRFNKYLKMLSSFYFYTIFDSYTQTERYTNVRHHSRKRSMK